MRLRLRYLTNISAHMHTIMHTQTRNPLEWSSLNQSPPPKKSSLREINLVRKIFQSLLNCLVSSGKKGNQILGVMILWGGML